MVRRAGAFYALAVAFWPILPVAAAGAALFRDAAMTPLVGEAVAHLAGCFIAAALAAIVALVFVQVVAPPQPLARWFAAGFLWLAMSVAWASLYGRIVMGRQWSELLADYNVLKGGLWPLMLLTALVAPVVLAAVSGKVRRPGVDEKHIPFAKPMELTMSDRPSVSDSFRAFQQDTPQFFGPWMEMIGKLDKASALDAKTQQLAYLAVLAAAGRTSGIPFHVRQARSAGASREEVISAILLGLPAVGTVVVQSLPPALEALGAK